MKVKRKDLRKRLPQLPINYPAPEIEDLDLEKAKARVENLCKRLAASEAEMRDAVLAELPSYIRDVCAAAVEDEEVARLAAGKDVDGVDYESPRAGQQLWAALDANATFAKLSLLVEKLCLGLYFCMWHSDKPLVQHACAQTIVDLMDAFPTPVLKELFWRSMLRTLARNWRKIDQWRMDKYLAMVRKLCAHMIRHAVDAVQDALAAEGNAKKASASPKAKGGASPSAGKKKAPKKAAAESPSVETLNVEEDLSPAACAKHPSMLRLAAAYQQDVVRAEACVGLSMHMCDLMLTELLRCEAVKAPLFVALSVAIPIHAMSRGDYVEKRVMDNFVVPIAAGQLEKRSQEFSLEVATILAAQFEALSVSRATHFSVRPLMVEAQRLMENYVGTQLHPEEYEEVTGKDQRSRIAAEIRAAEDIKMRMSRIAMKHAAAAGAVRAARRISKPTQPKSKRNARWKKR